MGQYEDFCRKLGDKYKEDYDSVCTDQTYNRLKTLGKDMDVSQYIQAASEQVFYYKLKKIFGNVKSDVNVNPANGTDVDLYCDGQPFNLRIEVKTPVLFENTTKYKEDNNKGIKIHGQQDHRYPESLVSRTDMNNSLNEIIESFGDQATVKKMDDNKIKDYLEGAQSKTIDSDCNTINVLLICLNSNDLATYFDYIVNPYTGLAGKEPYIEGEKYSNIDFIVLSNCVEGQIDSNFIFNVWDADNYVNFVIPNMNKITSENFNQKKSFIIDLFNDHFEDYLRNHNKYAKIDDVISDRLGIINYLTKNFIQFAPNDKLRKY